MGVGAAVVAFGCGGLVGCAEAAQVGGDDGEGWGEERDQPVPVVVVFGGAVEEEKGRPGSSCDVVEADAVYSCHVVGDGFAIVVVCFWHS